MCLGIVFGGRVHCNIPCFMYKSPSHIYIYTYKCIRVCMGGMRYIFAGLSFTVIRLCICACGVLNPILNYIPSLYNICHVHFLKILTIIVPNFRIKRLLYKPVLLNLLSMPHLFRCENRSRHPIEKKLYIL